VPGDGKTGTRISGGQRQLVVETWGVTYHNRVTTIKMVRV
jgi:hypothetical protein